MDRLTTKHWRNLDPWECCGQDNYCKRGCHEEGGCTKGCMVPKNYDRLAKYEDTGLSPKETAKLQAENAELRAMLTKCQKTLYTVAFGDNSNVDEMLIELSNSMREGMESEV